MINATYFGEITELDSRAVWYSDEEDDDDDDGVQDELAIKPRVKPVEPLHHETFRSSMQIHFKRISSSMSNFQFETCIVSLTSATNFKNLKISSQGVNRPILLGYINSVAKVFAYQIDRQSLNSQPKSTEMLLWLLFDASHQLISGQEVGYLVEKLRDTVQEEFNLNQSNPLLILSQQFSTSEHIEYLSNLNPQVLSLPFKGCPLKPPSLIRNQFESALFEQLSLAVRPAVVICLPDPKNFWFDGVNQWPTVPIQIIENKLSDDNLDKTLIFT